MWFGLSAVAGAIPINIVSYAKGLHKDDILPSLSVFSAAFITPFLVLLGLDFLGIGPPVQIVMDTFVKGYHLLFTGSFSVEVRIFFWSPLVAVAFLFGWFTWLLSTRPGGGTLDVTA